MHQVRSVYLVLLFIILIKNYDCQDPCRNKATCSSCISEAGCSWCSQVDFSGISHCRNDEDIKSCPINLQISPKSVLQILNESSIQLKPDKPLVQITPQIVNLKIRRGETVNIDFQYGHAPNFPIDLYYLMDLSASMKAHKENLANLGGQLIDTMKEITRDFRIGFGSFVDKTDMPFVFTVPDKLENPCNKNVKPKCVPAYSFKNHQSLTDGSTFSSQVKAAKVSGNIDTPEGGFDALMQVMVCKKEIGWREQARHLIVFSTDAVFHVAGDGKLAGVVEPNDNKCHMENSSYTHSLVYDYPSISHINYIASQHKYNIFFAIVENTHVYRVYERLKDQIDDSGVAPLKTNSNLPQLIVEYYNKLASKANMKDNAENNVEIKYSCKKSDGSDCTSLHSGDIVTYTAKIKLLDFSEKKKQQITISAETVNKGVIINLEEIHECSCENETVGKSEDCKNSGGLQCGICSCPKGFYGKRCECDGDNDRTSDEKPCINGNDTVACSGVGSCHCGTCLCDDRPDPNQKVYGPYCECDNYSCLKHANMLCGGNGKCDCGKCICNSGWSGDSCDCRVNIESCKRFDQVCNGRGVCKCDKCICEKGYYGQYCEECATCSGGRCDELKPCVECKAYNSGKFKDECDVKCNQYSITIMDEISDFDSEDIKVCRYEVENSCKMIFRYFYTDYDISIEARKEMQCPVAIVFELVTGLIVGILIAGIIALLVWKIFTHIHDKREYAKFEDERANSKWNRDENPLYKAAKTHYANPTYNE